MIQKGWKQQKKGSAFVSTKTLPRLEASLLQCMQKVLIVDDRKENRIALREVLGDLDIEFVEASCGNEALAATLDNHFAAAILDVMMPGMDGYELAEALRGDEATRTIPIILITASYEDAQHEFKGYESGAIDYLMKPFKPQILIGKLRILLEIDRNRQELLLHRNNLETLVAQRTAELEGRIKEKEVLLREIHHRVKNNLQVISGLLSLQADQTGKKDPNEIFRVCQDRIRSLALIHEKLYNSPSLAEIDFSQYLPALFSTLYSSYSITNNRILVDIKAESVFFTIEIALPLALIVNELLTNAIKHAFPDGRPGEIRISLQERRGVKFYAPAEDTGTSPGSGTARRAPKDKYRALAYELTVVDTGIGLPAGFDAASQKSLGLQLVDMLVKQLDGSLAIESNGGTSVRVAFETNEKSKK